MGQRRQSGDLYRPVYKEGTHLAPSKDTEGAVRGSLLDNETNQIAGQAEWVKVDESEYGYDEHYDYQEPRREKELSPEAQELAQLVGEAIAAGTIWVLSEVVAPRVKFWWQEKAAPAIREKWDDVKSKKKFKKTRKVRPVQSSEIAATSKTVSGMVSQELDEAYEKYAHDMTSEEAQRELMDIFILSVMLTAKIRKLSNARIIKNGGAHGEYIEGQEIIQKLSAPEYVASINQILENNPLLLEEKSATLSEILGRSIVLNGQYVPIESTQIREKLMVL
ncbi:hypothetical protein [Clostridium sp. OS1-26]|uniref:hypothetical protein n=1 Tax=Clostridium sp. OS1-26 TaxID=3070681 RepID=UPI0027E1BA6A|nr:hypothetical protein [Clostridium sp. OS1-26]WML33413.1 hypothetical protein RCG18_18960 [Clostridium sp. OS1-26]